MKQVISISAAGIMSGLQRKPGQGLNLQRFGPARTTRASEIVWDEEAQAWCVDVLQEAGRGTLTMAKLYDAVGGAEAFCRTMDSACPDGYDIAGGVLLFSGYDDAVKVEIAYLDALRLRGLH